MILLDTDHCIFFIRGHPAVVSAFTAHAADEPAISIMTVGELYFGALRSARPRENLGRCQALVARVSVIPLDEPIMLRFAEIKTGLFARGNAIEDPDLLIAATALSRHVPIATHNTSHIERIPDLMIEDWSV